MNIVFNINHLGLEGLGTTLTSLIRNCSDANELVLSFLCSDLNLNDKENIGRLLKYEKFYGVVEFIDFDAHKIFGRLNSLHGDWTPYGRLIISNYIKADEALYLDADLIVLLDVLSIKTFDFEDNILAAVVASDVSWALDGSFLIDKLKWLPETKYFNSGVIYFNLKKWRELNINYKWKKLSESFPNELISHDQTLLNGICEGKFARLPPIFNNPWYPIEKTPALASKSILHFVGSPKPWDIFGSVTHSGYKVWRSYNTEFWQRYYGNLTLKKIKRTWKIKNSILKCWFKKTNLVNLKYYQQIN